MAATLRGRSTDARTTEAGERPRRRRRTVGLAFLIVALVAGVGTFGVLQLVGSRGTTARHTPANASSSLTLYQSISKLDPRAVSAVGGGGVAEPLTSLPQAAPLVSGAKPIVLFVGTELCHSCAAQRWPLVIALTRFGTFSTLPLLVGPGALGSTRTATFTFHGATYTSAFVSLVAIEKADATGTPIEALTPTSQQLLDTYDTPPYVPASAAGQLPWLDIANRYAMQGTGFSADALDGLPWTTVAERLGKANDAVAQAIVGSANWITAAICRTTGMQPAATCRTAPIPVLAAQLP